MKAGVLYARVSTKDQEREGFSIPAQMKMLREYAARNEIHIVREFVDVETAKISGRKQFGQMVRFFEKNGNPRCVIVEKTDRLYRNFRDCMTLEDLEVEIHLAKEGQVIEKNARSQAKLIHGIQVVIARNYIDNLREEVRKGMREKAEQGIYPSRPPLGYRNNKLSHTIEIDPENAAIARCIFEQYATGTYSLSQLRGVVQAETGRKFQKGYLHKILRNPFYGGFFLWEGRQYKGTQALIVPPTTYRRAQAVLESVNRPKYSKHRFPFSGLLACAFDDCAVTAEIKKGKYVYYRCTGYRGKCDLPYMREEELGKQLGQILKAIHIPDAVLAEIQRSLTGDSVQLEKARSAQRERLEQRLGGIRRRIDQAYTDKLDGKISEEFWADRNAEWRTEEQQVLLALDGLKSADPDRLLTASRILELANKAHSLYLAQNPAEQGRMLRMYFRTARQTAQTSIPLTESPST